MAQSSGSGRTAVGECSEGYPGDRQEGERYRQQVEDNSTKALVNVLEHGGPDVARSFLRRFAPAIADGWLPWLLPPPEKRTSATAASHRSSSSHTPCSANSSRRPG